MSCPTRAMTSVLREAFDIMLRLSQRFLVPRCASLVPSASHDFSFLPMHVLRQQVLVTPWLTWNESLAPGLCWAQSHIVSTGE